MRQYFENAKISAVRSLPDDLFSARSNMVNYVYNLVCLCLLFSVLSIIHTVIIISVLFIRHVFEYEWYCLGSAVDS